MFNLFVVLIFTFIIALFLIYFIAQHDKKLKQKNDLALKQDSQNEANQPDFRQFSKICTDLCEILKLDIEDISHTEAGEVTMRAISQNPITKVTYLIVGFLIPAKATVPANKIMELSDQIISERISRGLIITTGHVEDTVKNFPELAPMDFLEASRLWDLVAEYKINF